MAVAGGRPGLRNRLVPPPGGRTNTPAPLGGGTTAGGDLGSFNWTPEAMRNARPMNPTLPGNGISGPGMTPGGAAGGGGGFAGGATPGGGGLFGGGQPGGGLFGGLTSTNAPAKTGTGAALPGAGGMPAKTPGQGGLTAGAPPGGTNFWDAAHKSITPPAQSSPLGGGQGGLESQLGPGTTDPLRPLSPGARESQTTGPQGANAPRSWEDLRRQNQARMGTGPSYAEMFPPGYSANEYMAAVTPGSPWHDERLNRYHQMWGSTGEGGTMRPAQADASRMGWDQVQGGVPNYLSEADWRSRYANPPGAQEPQAPNIFDLNGEAPPQPQGQRYDYGTQMNMIPPGLAQILQGSPHLGPLLQYLFRSGLLG